MDQIRLEHLGTIQMVLERQILVVARGCGSSARYACLYGYNGPWCVREPLDEHPPAVPPR